MDKYIETMRFIAETVIEESPRRILEIGGGGNVFGLLLRATQAYCSIGNGVVERIALEGAPVTEGDRAYDGVYGGKILDDPNTIGSYDLIVILDLFEGMEVDAARGLLDILQRKITKQVLVITPLNTAKGYIKYHPIVFRGLDFCWSLFGAAKETQAFSVFNKIEYEPMGIDVIPAADTLYPLRIAVVLPHLNLSGGMKALLQHIRSLTRMGHVVTAYCRSDTVARAIPSWSDLTDGDCAGQVVITSTERFLDNILDTDIILLGGMNQMNEFLNSKIPVALWEQGSEILYGDYGKHIYSASVERVLMHGTYRMPIHMLTVSDMCAAVMKGVYNRDAFLFPCGMDITFYHPAQADNELPIVLLTGNPCLKFKGFQLAFDVLERLYAQGLRFQAKWASPVPVCYSAVEFPLEVFVNPTQEELAALYRKADVFLSTSLYESYPLPPLEAMASGTAVIAADCGGLHMYAVDGENCVICRQGDRDGMVNALADLLSNRDERERLALAGRETALRHSAEAAAKLLERRLSDIVLAAGG